MNYENQLYPRYLFRKKLALSVLRNYYIKSQKPENFLEIGAGRGDFSQSLISFTKKASVIDFSPEAISILEKKLHGEGVRVISGDFLNYNFHDSYSLVVMFEVLEHIHDDIAALKKVHSLLRENGIFIFSVPSRMKYWAVGDEVAGHYRRYEKENLRQLLQEQKFEVLELFSYGFPLINLTSFFRNFIFGINYNKIKKSENKESLSEKSGLGYIEYFQLKKVISFAVKILFGDPLVTLYVNGLKPFNRFDLGDGYLCLCKKIN